MGMGMGMGMGIGWEVLMVKGRAKVVPFHKGV
jgi:hypothetical protein